MRGGENQLSAMMPEDDLSVDLDPQDLKGFSPFITCRSRMEQEKRLRREIANSNERRRMQSINVGFQSLKSLLPKRDGEKISKASILQQSVQYIRRLQAEKAQLLSQIYQYKQLMDLSAAKPPIIPDQNGLLAPAVSVAPLPPVDHVPPLAPIPLATSDTTGSPAPNQIQCPRVSSAPEPKTSPVSPPAPSHSSDSGAGSTVSSEAGNSPEPRPSPDKIQAPPKKRKFTESTDTDEGIGHSHSDDSGEEPGPKSPPKRPTPLYAAPIQPSPIRPTPIQPESLVEKPTFELGLLKRELLDMRLALDRERRSRVALEDHVIRNMELARIQTQMAVQSPVPAAMDCNKPVGLLSYPPGFPVPPAPVKDVRRGMSQPEQPPMVSTPAELQPVPGGRRFSFPPPVPNDLQLKLIEHQQRLLEKQAVKLPAASADHTANGTKQNLEVIVEAIRHLEGDQLFVDTSAEQFQPQGFRRMSFPTSRGFPMPLVSSLAMAAASMGPQEIPHHGHLTPAEENAIINEQIMIAERERKACKA